MEIIKAFLTYFTQPSAGSSTLDTSEDFQLPALDQMSELFHVDKQTLQNQIQSFKGTVRSSIKPWHPTLFLRELKREGVITEESLKGKLSEYEMLFPKALEQS